MYNSVYPLNIKPYVPPYVKPKTSQGGQNAIDEKEENAHSSNTSREAQQTNSNSSTDPNGRRNNYVPQEFPNGQKTTIDYSKSKVNIAQILTDFKNTAIAIGSPPTLLKEVEQYLSISEAESLKNEPNKKRIQANLKNASNILDEYISKTLNKKSKVVENWIDALFLQKVDYKSDPSSINPDFLVKLPDKETGEMKPISDTISAPTAETSTEVQQTALTPEPQTTQPIEQTTVPETTTTTTTTTTLETQPETIVRPAQEETVQVKAQPKSYMPENAEIKSALLSGKKHIASNKEDLAIKEFNKALELAMMYGDNNAEGIACFELGKIYDKNDNLPEALKFYNQAHNASKDNNLKARAYYNMAHIYDDVVYFEPAMNHYYAAISFACEAENLNAQTKALADIADMYADRYDVENTYNYYAIAKNIALETNNDKTKGAIWMRSADSLSIINENANALRDYKISAQYYEKAESPIKMAKNYEKAAQIMLKLGNSQKAQSLYEKAQKFAQRAAQEEFKTEIERRLES